MPVMISSRASFRRHHFLIISIFPGLSVWAMVWGAGRRLGDDGDGLDDLIVEEEGEK